MPYRAAIRIAASLIIGVVCRAYSVLAATPPEPPMTCAIIGDVSLKESPLAALLQEKLARPGIRFVERDEVERVLAEKTLQAAFAPDGAADRVRLGALLKAEQLILLRRSEPTPNVLDRAGQGDPPALEIVVCESSRGLRLAAQAVAIEKDLAATIAAAEPVVSAAICKGRMPIREVVAVPPFISNDLSYRYDSLKSAYARALEQMLLEETGVLVVELEEARTIARESILAGERPGLRRPLPLYLMGEFRNQGTDEQRTVWLRIGIRRGDEVIGEVAKEGISPRAVTVLLRAAAVKAVGTPTPADPAKAATPEVEARQLTDRARLFQGLGNWSEALGLMEASLLLKPDQIALHHDAVVACGRLTRRVMWDNSETNTLEQVRWAAEQYLRGLEHLEAFLRDVPDLRSYETRGQNSFVVEFHHSNAGWGIPRSASKGTVEEVAVAKSMARESWLRIARMRLRDGRGDESKYVMYATADMPDRERYPLMLDLIREWQDQPGNARRVREMASHGYTVEVLKSAEGQTFLAALMKMENQEIRSTAASLVREVEAYESHKRDAAAAWKTEEARRKAEDAAARAGGPPEVIFEALRLTPFSPLVRCVAAGDRIDAFWSSRAIYLMKEKGTLRTVWQASELNARPAFLVFDGKYVWAPVQRQAKPPQLLVIDPTSEKVWEFTERDGLPTTRIDDPQEALRTPQYLRVAPLGPGRACVAGYFGRTWLAMATFDPQVGPVQGRSIKVFHEARDVGNEEDKTQWQSPSVAFQPAYMFALADPAARDGKASQRVLIGRGGSTINVNHHPLLVDVDTLKVSVIADEGCWQEAYAYEGSYDSTIAEGGAVYWAWPARRRSEEPFAPTVYRMGFPDFKRETVMTRAHTGREATYRDRVFFHAGDFFIAARQWYVSDGPGKPFRMLRGDVPERMDIERLFRGPRATAPVTPEDTEAVVAICKSNHYGLVCVSSIGRMYQVSFPGLSVH